MSTESPAAPPEAPTEQGVEGVGAPEAPPSSSEPGVQPEAPAGEPDTRHPVERYAKPPGTPGRPPSLTRQRWDSISGLLKAGNFRDVAASQSGVQPSLMSEWMKRGEEDLEEGRDTLWSAFALMVYESEAKAESYAVAVVMRAGQHEAKHAEWFLARKFPQRWARKDTLQITGAEGGPIEIGVAREQLAKLLDQLLSDDGDSRPPGSPDAGAPAAEAPAGQPGEAGGVPEGSAG